MGGSRLHGRDGDVVALTAFVLGFDQGLVLTGAAGVGKTSLAREATRIAAENDVAVVWVQATASAHEIPFGAMAPYLPVVDATLDMLPMLMQAAAALRTLADGRKLLLVLDDAPLIDNASALLVSQLVAAGEACVLITQRSGATLPEPIAALRVPRRELGTLDLDATIAVAEELTGAAVARVTSERLFHLSGGNPLFVHELVLSAHDTGAWQHAADGLRLDDQVATASRLTELVDVRFRGLSDDAADAVALLALGEPMGLTDVESLTSAKAIELLDEAGLVDVVVDGRRTQLRLGHPIYAEVWRARMSVLRQRRIYLRLAERLSATGAHRREDLMRLATWHLDAGTGAPSELLLAAAVHARRAGDVALAERCARISFDTKPTFEAGHLLADTMFREGRTDEVERVLDRVEALDLTVEQRTACVLTRAADRYWNAGDGAGAETLLADAVQSSGPARDQMVAFGAGLLAASRNFGEAWSLARTFVEGPSGRERVDAAVAAGFSLRGMGRGEEAVALVDAALAAYDSIEDVTVLTMKVLGSAKTLALLDLGRLDEGDAAASATVEAAKRSADNAALALALNCLGWSCLYRGRFTTGRHTYVEAAGLLRGLGRRGQLRWALIGAFFAAASAGDVAAATRLREEVDELGPHPATIFDGQLGRAHAALLMVTGEPEQARELLVQTAIDSAETDDLVTEAACWHDLVRFGRPELARERLEALSARIDGAWAPLFARHATAACERDADELGAVAVEFAALGAIPFAADAARAAADAAAHAGDQRVAARWSVQAAEWADRLELERDVSAGGLGGADPLTRREREVAELAAQGLASKAIAERLFVSTRTVESHLLRVYTKLGVRSRAELVDTLTSRSA